MGYENSMGALVDGMIVSGVLRSDIIIEAFTVIDRKYFVPDSWRDETYIDNALPIGNGQTISQPYIVALMTESLRLGGTEKVLEIGTGSGYQAAILAQIVYRVYTIERIRSLHIQARTLFDKLHYHNIVMKYADGTKGWQDESPFDGIIVTAGAPQIPDVLIDQLGEGGRLVVPVGNQHTQELIKIFRDDQHIRQTNLGGCRFVKLVGEHGWKET